MVVFLLNIDNSHASDSFPLKKCARYQRIILLLHNLQFNSHYSVHAHILGKTF